jgi:hypothetical protein
MPPKVNLRIKKPKLLRSNPLRFTLIRLNGVNPVDIEFDDEALCTRYQRPKLVKIPDLDDEEISAHARIRLVIARVKALQKYREIHYNTA